MLKSELEGVEKYSRLNIRQLWDVPLPEMLIEGLLPRRTLTGLTAKPGAGKTWLTLELARSIATGTKFLGHFQCRPGNVVFVGQDADICDYARQIRKLFKAEVEMYDAEIEAGQRVTNPFDDRFSAIIDPGLLIEDQHRMKRLAATVLDIEHSERDVTRQEIDTQTGELVEHSDTEIQRGTDLIVLDSESSMTRLDQNNNTDMEIAFRNLRWLAKVTNAGVVIIHHNGNTTEFNDGENWRGASSQVGALDNWFNLKPHPRHPNRVLFQVKRFRGLRPDDFNYTMSHTDDSSELMYEVAEEEHAVNIEMNLGTLVADWLRQNQGYHPAIKIRDGIWPSVSDFIPSRDTCYDQVRRELAKPENHALYEKGPGRSGYRLNQYEAARGEENEVQGDAVRP